MQAATAAEVEAEVERFVAAFGGQAAVYWGGPDALSEPALCVHARANLPGATELSESTRVYRGGARAAAAAVLAGEARPLEFRWFVGRHAALSTRRGEWRSLACARPLLLKRCQVSKYDLRKYGGSGSNLRACMPVWVEGSSIAKPCSVPSVARDTSVLMYSLTYLLTVRRCRSRSGMSSWSCVEASTPS